MSSITRFHISVFHRPLGKVSTKFCPRQRSSNGSTSKFSSPNSLAMANKEVRGAATAASGQRTRASRRRSSSGDIPGSARGLFWLRLSAGSSTRPCGQRRRLEMQAHSHQRRQSAVEARQRAVDARFLPPRQVPSGASKVAQLKKLIGTALPTPPVSSASCCIAASNCSHRCLVCAV